MEAHERARAAVEQWRRSEAEARIRGWGELDEAEPLPTPAWPTLEAETFVDAELAPAERGAAAAHLARAAFERAIGPFRERRREDLAQPVALERDRVPASVAAGFLLDPNRARSAARALEVVGRSLARGADEATQAGAERAGRWLRAVEAPPHPDGGPSAADRRALAEKVLDESQSALDAVRDRFGVAELWQWPLAVHGDRSLFRPERRFQRIAADLEGWGFRSVLAAHVSVAPERPALRSRLAARRVPERIRIAGPSVDGVLGEWLAAEGLGRALALSLVSPAAASPLRRPVAETVGRALGVLVAQVATGPVALRKRGLTLTESRAAVSLGAAVALLRVRLDAAAVLAEGAPLEGRASLVARATGTGADPGAAFLLTTSAASPRFRASVAGLALYPALREHFDEDFFRNPRAAEPIRGAATRGGALSAEAFVEEVDGAQEQAIARLAELAELALA
ncbi:MAG: hypothetical protein JJ863_28575 [Deltaproteobacteria bacterium]|nr:hypothetical protein [Deltaproteobacteria bacterium]